MKEPTATQDFASGDLHTRESAAAVMAAQRPEATRPWEGATNPYEAIYQHFTAEIARLESLLPASKKGS